MAIQADYNFKEFFILNSYIKIKEISINKIENEFTISSLIEVKKTKDELLYDNFFLRFNGNPEISVYTQAYDKLKELYPNSISV